jgi:hypothetical protein
MGRMEKLDHVEVDSYRFENFMGLKFERCAKDRAILSGTGADNVSS